MVASLVAAAFCRKFGGGIEAKTLINKGVNFSTFDRRVHFVELMLFRGNTVGGTMGIETLSTFEWRRIATGWWYSRARNARFAALSLAKLCDEDIALKFAKDTDYHDTPSIALYEAFSREAAISLELIIKAVIARTLELQNADPAHIGVPLTHNLPDLWKKAGLPSVSPEDQYRLHRFKSILIWAGKYPTPRTEKAWEEERDEFKQLEGPPERHGKPVIRKPISCKPEDFERLYKIAETRLRELMKQRKFIAS